MGFLSRKKKYGGFEYWVSAAAEKNIGFWVASRKKIWGFQIEVSYEYGVLKSMKNDKEIH